MVNRIETGLNLVYIWTNILYNMNFTENIIPISHLKANASKVVEDAYTNNQTYVITQNGYAKMVLIGIKEYDMMLRELNNLSGFKKKQNLEKKISRIKKNPNKGKK